jgi:hypothetical protein
MLSMKTTINHGNESEYNDGSDFGQSDTYLSIEMSPHLLTLIFRKSTLQNA